MGGRKQRAANMMKVKYAKERDMSKNMDDLAAFEEFRAAIAPELRRMLIKGAKDTEILKKFKSFGAARLVQIIGTGSEGASLTAIRELFDRTDGKAPVKTENTHKFQKLPDAELDAILESQIKGLEAIESGLNEEEVGEPEDEF